MAEWSRLGCSAKGRRTKPQGNLCAATHGLWGTAGSWWASCRACRCRRPGSALSASCRKHRSCWGRCRYPRTPACPLPGKASDLLRAKGGHAGRCVRRSNSDCASQAGQQACICTGTISCSKQVGHTAYTLALGALLTAGARACSLGWSHCHCRLSNSGGGSGGGSGSDIGRSRFGDGSVRDLGQQAVAHAW